MCLLEKTWFKLCTAAILNETLDSMQSASAAVAQRYSELKLDSVIYMDEWRELDTARRMLHLA